MSWKCKNCETINADTLNECEVCGQARTHRNHHAKKKHKSSAKFEKSLFGCIVWLAILLGVPFLIHLIVYLILGN